MTAHSSEPRQPVAAPDDGCEQGRPMCCYCDAPCVDDDVVAGTETDDAPLFICAACCDQFYREYVKASRV